MWEAMQASMVAVDSDDPNLQPSTIDQSMATLTVMTPISNRSTSARVNQQDPNQSLLVHLPWYYKYLIIIISLYLRLYCGKSTDRKSI